MLAESPNARGTSIARYSRTCPPRAMPLDPSTLCARTAAGDAELAAPRHGLAIAQRRLLSLLERPAPLEELMTRPGVLPDRLEKDLGRLSEHGLVALHGPSKPVKAPSKVAPATMPLPAPTGQEPSRPWVPAQPGLGATTSGPAPESRVILGRRVRLGRAILLGFLTLCIAGMVAWWFSLPTREAVSPALPTPPPAPKPAPPVPAPVAPRTVDAGVSVQDRPSIVAGTSTALAPSPAAEPPPAIRSTSPPRPAPPGMAAEAHAPEKPAPLLATTRVENPVSGPRIVAAPDPAPAARATPSLPPAMPSPLPAPVPATDPASSPPPATLPASPQAPVPARSESAIPAAPPAAAPVTRTGSLTAPPPAPAPIASAAPSMLPAKAASGRLEPVTREAPMFPRDALAQGIDRGTVRARLSIDASGKVTDVEILEAQPRRVFDRAVRSALGRWTYPPGEASRTTVVEVAFQRD